MVAHSRGGVRHEREFPLFCLSKLKLFLPSRPSRTGINGARLRGVVPFHVRISIGVLLLGRAWVSECDARLAASGVGLGWRLRSGSEGSTAVGILSQLSGTQRVYLPLQLRTGRLECPRAAPRTVSSSCTLPSSRGLSIRWSLQSAHGPRRRGLVDG